MSSTYEVDNIQVIELNMMDKHKYYPLTLLSGFSIRSALYPFSLIKTRIQVQKKKSLYNGTFDAFRKIRKAEGFRGLYKGFWVSNLFVVSQMTYIATYENVRRYLADYTNLQNKKTRSFIAGGCASIAAQTFVVPIDIVSQHLMMMERNKQSKPSTSTLDPLKLYINEEYLKSRLGATKAVIRAVYNLDGIKGFYKGYLTSLMVYAPNSALWWFFYDIYCDSLASIFPAAVPRLVLQTIAAPIGGVTTSLITNPMDIVRARIQIDHSSFSVTIKHLWEEEGWRIFVKGLSARLVQSITYSFFIVLGYESLKRWSLLDKYKDSVRW